MPEPLPHERALGNGFAVLAGATLALMVVGALVRAHGAGLACPDWPLCFGQVLPTFDMRIALEWGHRTFAGGVSLGLVALSWMLLRRPALRQVHGTHLALVWALLLVQVGLGGATVLLQLAPWTVTAHLLTGTTLLLSLAWLAANLRAGRGASAAPAPRAVGGVLGLALGLLALQLLLGGMVSSRSAGLACAYFPSCDGQSFLPALEGGVALHALHRLNGYGLLLAYAALALVARPHPTLARWSRAALALIALQIGVGAANVLLRLPPEITALHTLTAAGIALTSALLLREWLRARARATEPGAAVPRVARAALEAR
jgi:heme a synthase